jgi:two-component system nitrate/nitrite response regulator NarL
MRILICAPHLVFAESLAHLLELHGEDVVAVVDDIGAALMALQAQPVDVCLIDLWFETEADLAPVTRLWNAAPETRFVLLSEVVDTRLLAVAAAGLGTIAEKRRPFADLAELLAKVHAGAATRETVPSARVAPGEWRGGRDDRRWLAAFLTPRERQVLSALVCGEDTVKLARSMGISATTVRCHIQSVLNKLGAHSRLEAATAAVRDGMVCPRTGEWLIDLAS